MKKTIIGITALLSTTVLFAQGITNELISNTSQVESTKKEGEDGWTTGGTISLNFSNVGLQNWAAGGSNSYAITGLTSLNANLIKGKSTWDNSLDLGLGMIQQFTSITPKENRIWIKSDDKIDFTSKYGQKASDVWYYSGLLNFKTQFMPGFDDPYLPDSSRSTISDLLAPAYGIVALGMDYKPNSNFSGLIAPLSSKVTIVAVEELNAIGAFGVDPGESMRVEYGAYARLLYNKDVMKNINFSTKLELFQNYQDLKNLDVNWETLTSMKVNEYISATFGTQMIYDNDIKIAKDENNNGLIEGTIENRSRIQFKHVLNIGLTYKF